MAKLDVKALGLTLGIVWGGSLLVMGLVAMSSGYGTGFVASVGSLYVGYKPTLVGSLAGAGLGFLDAGIGGLIIAWLYNKLSK